jgi:hypothetical protein
MRAAWALGAVLALGACEAVPSIDFTHDGGEDDGGDGGTRDGADQDAARCPDTGTTVTFCCPGAKAIPCAGIDCNKSICDKCVQQCFEGQICCPRNPGQVDCPNLTQGC